MTQHVEGAHSAMKHAIETSGSLTKSFNSLNRWLHLHHEERLLQYENESINIDLLLTLDDKNRLKPLLGKVAQFALNKIKHELLKVTTYKACLCELQVNYNIPCRHMLPIKGSFFWNQMTTDCIRTYGSRVKKKKKTDDIRKKQIEDINSQQNALTAYIE
ncbi:11374_t:CDS:2, partial [Racocetra persica]